MPRLALRSGRCRRPRSRSPSWARSLRRCGFRPIGAPPPPYPPPQAGEGREGEGEMKFGLVPPGDAKGGIVVHSIRQSGLALKKGSVVGDADIAALKAAGIKAIMVARIEPDDVSEDTAAAELAAAIAGEGVRVDHAFTGR